MHVIKRLIAQSLIIYLLVGAIVLHFPWISLHLKCEKSLELPIKLKLTEHQQYFERFALALFTANRSPRPSKFVIFRHSSHFFFRLLKNFAIKNFEATEIALLHFCWFASTASTASQNTLSSSAQFVGVSVVPCKKVFWLKKKMKTIRQSQRL